MSKAFKCDKCGKLYDYNDCIQIEPKGVHLETEDGCATSDFQIIHVRGGMDLCVDCQLAAINALCDANRKPDTCRAEAGILKIRKAYDERDPDPKVF